jgi:hypothetical protein
VTSPAGVLRTLLQSASVGLPSKRLRGNSGAGDYRAEDVCTGGSLTVKTFMADTDDV